MTKREKIVSLLNERAATGVSTKELMKVCSCTFSGVTSHLYNLRKRLKKSGRVLVNKKGFYFLKSSTPVSGQAQPIVEKTHTGYSSKIPGAILECLQKAPHNAKELADAIHTKIYNIYWAIGRLKSTYRILLRNHRYALLGKKIANHTLPAPANKPTEMMLTVGGLPITINFIRSIPSENRSSLYDLVKQAVFYTSCVRGFVESYEKINALMKEVGESTTHD